MTKKYEKRMTPLKMAIWNADLTYKDLSDQSGISHGYISMAANGRLELRPVQMAAIAAALQKPVADLFSSNKGTACMQ